MLPIFEMLFLLATLTKFLRGKALRGNLICYFSRTKGRRNLKFGEIGLQICQIFLRKTSSKKSSDLNALLTLKKGKYEKCAEEYFLFWFHSLLPEPYIF